MSQAALAGRIAPVATSDFDPHMFSGNSPKPILSGADGCHRMNLAVSLQVEESERSAQTAWESGQASAGLWHVEAARSKWNTLDALHDRFPGTADTSLTSRKLSELKG